MQGSQELAPDREDSDLRALAQNESDPSGATVSLERDPGGMQQTPSRFKEVTLRHASSLVNVLLLPPWDNGKGTRPARNKHRRLKSLDPCQPAFACAQPHALKPCRSMSWLWYWTLA